MLIALSLIDEARKIRRAAALLLETASELERKAAQRQMRHRATSGLPPHVDPHQSESRLPSSVIPMKIRTGAGEKTV